MESVLIERDGLADGGGYHFQCRFSDERGAVVRIPRGMERSGIRSDEACDLFRRVYSSLFEDHMVNLEARAVRRVFEEARRRGADPAQLRQLHDQIVERERHIRDHHARPDGITWVNAEAVQHRGHRTIDYRQMYVEGISVDRVAYDEMAQIDPVAWRVWSRALERNLEEATYFDWGHFGVDVGDPAAQAKGIALLKANLTPVQLQQYEKRKHFEVVGCDTRKLYRIRHGRQMNIEELDTRHRRVCGWCFLPSGALVVGDVLLAQKIALETNETAALKIANRFG